MARLGEYNYAACDVCGLTYIVSTDNFRKYSKAINGNWYHTTCRKCEDAAKRLVEWKDGKLLCHICNQYLPVDLFQEHPYYEYRDHHECRCKKCKAEQNKQVRILYSEEVKLLKLLLSRFLNARDRARRKRLPFNITKEYLKKLWDKQFGLCAISNIPMTYINDAGRIPTNISIDLINPNQGYTIGNILLVCMAVNLMKSDLTLPELYLFCNAIIENHSKKK